MLKVSYFPNPAQLTFTNYRNVNMPAIQLINKACYLKCGQVNETNVNSCWNSFSYTKAYAITSINPRKL